MLRDNKISVAQMDQLDLRIGQLNAGRGAIVNHEIRKIAEDLQLDVICVQEPYARDGGVPGLPHMARIITSDLNPRAVTIILNKNIAVTVVQQYTDEHCVCVKIISGGCGLILVNQYFQFADPLEQHLDKTREILRKYGDRSVLIMADVNAKSALWHSETSDDRGRVVKLLVAEADLEVLNRPTPIPMYRGRAGANSNIDVTMITSELVEKVTDWTVEDGLTSSDHNLIHVVVRGTPPASALRHSTGKYNLRKAKWDLLKEKYCQQPFVAVGRVDDAAKALTSKLRGAMDIAIPRVKPTLKITNRMWTDRLSDLRAQTRRARKHYQTSTTREERANRLHLYREKKAEYEQELFATKINSWGKFMEECLQTDVWGTPYKIATEKMHPPVVLSTFQMEGEGMTGDWKETANVLMESLLPSDDMQGETPEQVQMRQEMRTRYVTEERARPFEVEEVKAAITRLGKRKSPGLDMIQSEVLHFLKDDISEELCKLCNRCLDAERFPTVWKRANVVILKKGEDKDPRMAKSYRPICLLSNFGKLLERLVIDRLQEHRMLQGLHPNQYGFRPKKSTEDALNRLVETVQQTEARYVMAIFVDVAGAFDNLW